ncbi:MAG: tRNA lysidine(34) synthetase TilS [Verrucomicrobiaceae bacterium]|nr:MAG: tRNA lysidine(34) synthetase TilS [Verrucomicrobiaceae bacterium]
MEGVSLRRPLLVGVSGGRDSMALLHALRALGFEKLIVCHLDHGLRGRASRADAEFVRRSASGCGFESARARTDEFAKRHRISTEAAARELRYAFFRECARRHRCRRLLLAHHADDQVETCLFQFLRGSGAAGLAGMKPVSLRGGMTIIRPLLAVGREEIDRYIAENAIRYREDGSNTSTVHTRNRIRHVVIPAIRDAFGPSFRDAVLRASEILRMEDEWMESQVPETGARLSCRELRQMPDALRHRAVIRWLRKSGVPEPGFAETRRVLSLLDPASGPAKVSLPGNLHARRRAGEIFLGNDKK